MKLLQGSQRYMPASHSSTSMMWDMLAVLMVTSVLPVIYHGAGAALLLGSSMAVCLGAYILFQLMTRREIWITDASPLVTGAMIALLLPANIPYWVVFTADVFAIWVVKEPFGGTGRNLFNPAAAGVAFVTVLWPERVFSYYNMNIGQSLTLSGSGWETVSSPAAWLREGIQPTIMPFEMVWGRYEGPMGATVAAVIGAGALYLLIRKSIDWRIPVFFLATAALYAAIFPRLLGGAVISVKYELLSGSLLFCACYMAVDPCTSPRTAVGKCIFGAMGGLLVMLLRNYGAYEQGGCFAILLLNALSPLIDRVVLACRREVLSRESKKQRAQADS